MCKDSNDTVAREPYLSTLDGAARHGRAAQPAVVDVQHRRHLRTRLAENQKYQS